jgi:hypothetical protein
LLRRCELRGAFGLKLLYLSVEGRNLSPFIANDIRDADGQFEALASGCNCGLLDPEARPVPADQTDAAV